MKQCTKCLEFKELEEFRRDKRKPDGRVSVCKPCQSDIDKHRYSSTDQYKQKTQQSLRRKIAQDYVRSYKIQNPCQCGEKEPVALAFHHLEPGEKDFIISAALNYSLDKIKNEIAKCIVVCHNCHAKIHAGLFTGL